MSPLIGLSVGKYDNRVYETSIQHLLVSHITYKGLLVRNCLYPIPADQIVNQTNALDF